MLMRELAARYLGAGGTIRVDTGAEVLADDVLGDDVLADLAQAGPVVDLQGGGDPASGDVVLISVDPAADKVSDRLTKVTDPTVTVLLLLSVPADELPVGRLAQAASTAQLAFVELAPIEPGVTAHTAVVCRPSSRPVPVRPFLGNGSNGSALGDEVSDGVADEVAVDLDRQGLRIAWEWGLGDARARAVEVLGRAAITRAAELEHELTETRRALDQAGKDLEVQRGVAERSEARADAEARRRGAIQQSSSFLVGRALLSVRRNPLRAIPKALRATQRVIRRSVRR